jgi:hypothetical protein
MEATFKSADETFSGLQPGMGPVKVWV